MKRKGLQLVAFFLIICLKINEKFVQNYVKVFVAIIITIPISFHQSIKFEKLSEIQLFLSDVTQISGITMYDNNKRVVDGA